MEYEICFLVGESKESGLDKTKSAIEKIVKKHQGVFTGEEFVNKRRLAYEIGKEARGTFVAMRFTLPDKDERDEKFPGVDFIGDMTRDLNFNQDVLRFIIVKADELPSLEELKKKLAEEKAEKETADGKKDENVVKSVKSVGKDKDEKKKVVAEKETTDKKEEDENEKDEVKVDEQKEAKEEKDEKKEEEKEEKKEEEKKEEKVEKKEGEKKEKKKKDEITEDDIDEKLDEILNI